MGLTGAVGTVGVWMTLTLTGLVSPFLTVSRSATVLENCWPTASAMAVARAGEWSVTATSISTVSSGTVAVMLDCSCLAVMSSLRLLITGLSTAGVVMTSA